MEEIALGEHSAVEIAAAFMQMKLGDEIEDIRQEKFQDPGPAAPKQVHHRIPLML
mgnify:CR=1 FL=1